jgi:hypothetical protein
MNQVKLISVNIVIFIPTNKAEYLSEPRRCLKRLIKEAV